jgi:hypothetical protein
VVVKATFELGARGVMRLSSPDPVERGERVDASGAFVAADDLAPFLSRADVWVVGAGPDREPERSRLRIDRGSNVLLDRSIEGGASRDAAGRLRFPALGPLSRGWPVRRRLLGSVDPQLVEGQVLAIPDAFDWRYFQAAPLDQRIEYLHGTERVVIEGLARGGRIDVRLPGFMAAAALSAAGSTPRALRMVGDSLAIDLDRMVAHLVFRGHALLQGDPQRARVVARLVGVDDAVDAPASQVPLSSTAPADATHAVSSADAPELSLAVTNEIEGPELERLRGQFATPFERAPVVAAASPEQAAADPPRRAASLGGSTLDVDPDEVASLRAQYLPFTPSTHDPQAPAHGSHVPFARPRAPELESTAGIDEAELRALRAARATPFRSPAADASHAPAVVAPEPNAVAPEPPSVESPPAPDPEGPWSEHFLAALAKTDHEPR